MTTTSKSPGFRRYRWALGFAAVSGLWLFASASDTHEQRALFGLWRIPAFVVGAGLGWFAVGSLAIVRSRTAFFKFTAVSVAIGFGLGLVEAAGWLLPGGLWPGAQISKLGAERSINETRSGKTYQDTFSQWGIETEPIAFEYKTDCRGFRHGTDHEDPSIILLGDSILVSALLPFEETLTGRIDEALPADVANVALIGIGPQTQLELLRESLPDPADKLVVQFVFEGNDLRDSSKYRSGRSPWQSDPKSRSFTFQLLLAMQRWTDPIAPIARRQTGRIRGEEYAFLWDRTSFEGFEAEVPAVLESLAATKRFVEDGGGRYAVAFVPAKIRVLGPLCTFPEDSNLVPYQAHLNPLRGDLQQWAEAQRVPLHDLTEPLIESARDGDVPWFRGDTHLNATGHAVMAESMLASDLLR